MRSLLVSCLLVMVVAQSGVTGVFGLLDSVPCLAKKLIQSPDERWCDEASSTACEECPGTIGSDLLDRSTFFRALRVVSNTINYGEHKNNALFWVRRNSTGDADSKLVFSCFRLRAEVVQPPDASSMFSVVKSGLSGDTVQINYEFTKPCNQFGSSRTSSFSNMTYTVCGQRGDGKLNELNATRVWAPSMNMGPRRQYMQLSVIGGKKQGSEENLNVAIGRLIEGPDGPATTCDYEAYISTNGFDYVDTIAEYFTHTRVFQGSYVDDDGKPITDIRETMTNCVHSVSSCD